MYENRYEHKIYVPTVYGVFLTDLKQTLSNKYGGCSNQGVFGYWLDSSCEVISENIRIISVITQDSEPPEAFLQAKTDLIQRGEECVLITCQEIKAAFLSMDSGVPDTFLKGN